MPQPDSHPGIKAAVKPILMAAIANDMHRDIITDIQTPKKIIWRRLKTSSPFLVLGLFYPAGAKVCGSPQGPAILKKSAAERRRSRHTARE
jgi:hypothetical protein